MKSLNEIIQEIDERRLPGNMGELDEYLKQMNALGVSSSSRVSMLVAHSRRTFFAEESGFHKWAKEKLNFTSNHTSHCAKIGSLLLDASSGSFQKLAVLPFNKLIAVSRLAPQQIDKLLEGRDVAGMSRDQLRDEVRKELNEPTPEPKQQDPNAESFKAVAKIAALAIEELDGMVKASGAQEAEAMLKAGRNMLAAGIEAATAKGLDGVLEAAERLLSLQLNAIKKQRDAVKAAKTIKSLETKTA